MEQGVGGKHVLKTMNKDKRKSSRALWCLPGPGRDNHQLWGLSQSGRKQDMRTFIHPLHFSPCAAFSFLQILWVLVGDKGPIV